MSTHSPSPPSDPVACLSAGPEHGPALTALFERVGSACYCRYWHFGGDKNAWLDRLAHAPERNADEFVHDLETSRSELRGIVALLGEGTAVGWMKLTSAGAVPKLYAQRVYRGLPCFEGDRQGVLTVGCFLVDPAFRKRGIGRALLQTGIAAARLRGAKAIEAFPRRAEMLGDEEVWTGPFGLYASQGFQVVREFAPYPVLRLDL